MARLLLLILFAFLSIATGCSDRSSHVLVGKWEIVKQIKYGRPVAVSETHQFIKVAQSGDAFTFTSYAKSGKVGGAFRCRVLANGDIAPLDQGTARGALRARPIESGRVTLEEVGGEDVYEIVYRPEAVEPNPDERTKAIEMVKCDCGQLNESGSKFCRECGRRL
jgi:hypothetical protein